MDKMIKVQIFGVDNWVVSGGCGGCSSKSGSSSDRCGGCSSKEGGCGGCGSSDSSGGCGSKAPKAMGELFNELVSSIQSSDIKGCVELEFIDIRKINILDYDDIRYLYDEGYELPYCVIDGVVRYYGGILSSLIYKDVKELIEAGQ
jgi:hypothetical protein